MEWTPKKEREDEENYRRDLIGIIGRTRKELREAKQNLSEAEEVLAGFKADADKHQISLEERREFEKRIESICADILRNIEHLEVINAEAEERLREV